MNYALPVTLKTVLKRVIRKQKWTKGLAAGREQVSVPSCRVIQNELPKVSEDSSFICWELKVELTEFDGKVVYKKRSSLLLYLKSVTSLHEAGRQDVSYT